MTYLDQKSLFVLVKLSVVEAYPLIESKEKLAEASIPISKDVIKEADSCKIDVYL